MYRKELASGNGDSQAYRTVVLGTSGLNTSLPALHGPGHGWATIRYIPPPGPYTVKKVIIFPVPSRDVTNQILPAGKNLILPDQGEFG